MSIYSDGRRLLDNQQYAKAYHIFKTGANQGDCKCKYGVGALIVSKKVKSCDDGMVILNDALPKIEELAKSGDAEAITILGYYHKNGFCMPADSEAAVRLFEAASNGGYAPARFLLGMEYIRGELFWEGVELIELAASDGYALAQHILGVMYHTGREMFTRERFTQDFDKAFYWLNKAAENGLAMAQTILAEYYLKGRVVPMDEKRALKLFKLAAAAGNVEAKQALSLLRLKNAISLGGLMGGGNRERKAKETKALKMMGALERDKTVGERGLGTAASALYEVMANKLAVQMSHGGQEDLIQSVSYYEDLIKRNPAYLQIYEGTLAGICFKIGKSFEHGPTDADENASTEWYIKAEGYGSAEARLLLGIKYYEGRGCEQDYSKALGAFSKSIDCGVQQGVANFYMGNCYSYGFGVFQDKRKALEYYNVAMQYGFNCEFTINSILYCDQAHKSSFREYAVSLLTDCSSTQLYQKIAIDLKQDFAPCWDRLKANAQTSLLTAVTFYVNLLAMGEALYRTQDFSPVINEMAKAFEIELAEFFFKGYIEFLKKKNISAANVYGLKKYLIFNDDGSVSYPNSNKTQLFSLGGLRFILGIQRESEGSTHGNAQFIRYNGDKVWIAPEMVAYADTLFRQDAFDTSTRKRDIVKYLIELADGVLAIKEYRNPGAHERIMSCSDAELCGDMLIKVKKMIFDFISKIDETRF